MVANDSSAADLRGKPTYEPAEVSVRADHSARQVVVELVDLDAAGVELRLAPEQGLELALRLAAAVARLLRIER
jgi:hypothetical protein